MPRKRLTFGEEKGVRPARLSDGENHGRSGEEQQRAWQARRTKGIPPRRRLSVPLCGLRDQRPLSSGPSRVLSCVCLSVTSPSLFCRTTAWNEPFVAIHSSPGASSIRNSPKENTNTGQSKLNQVPRKTCKREEKRQFDLDRLRL
ncbi:unnamed protein product [Caenorhabditis auriculariae]|uniref:Uncharacterized protein n=1 Tax=Caenorhabditis auriculariae TaxID=2777116 RepID=A0A8S1H1R1_9PELO|nr:unnamed protein product [Caenorhabditis auriculariae]